jgi:hypothetical protein
VQPLGFERTLFFGHSLRQIVKLEHGFWPNGFKKHDSVEAGKAPLLTHEKCVRA